MRLSATALTALSLAPITIVGAQSASALNAAFALERSHVGALAPLLTPAMISRTLNGAQLAIRYGLRDDVGTRTQAVAGSAIFGAGMKSSVSITGGVTDLDCPGCGPALMLGVGGDMRVYESGDPVGSGSTLSLALSGDLGYAKLEPSAQTGLVLAVGLPLTVGFGANREGLRFAPYFTPALGVGSVSDSCNGLVTSDCEESGMRWLLGGGIGIWNSLTSVSVTIGVNQVLIERAKPVLGINVIVGGR